MSMRGPSGRRSLAPHESMARQAAVDWASIEQKLHNIPEDFKSQKFNSLKRVIEILSKEKPQWALAEVCSGSAVSAGCNQRPAPRPW
jgi:hypothetical protein